MEGKQLIGILDSFISDAQFMVEMAQKEKNIQLQHAWDIRLQQSELIKSEINSLMEDMLIPAA